MDGKTSQQGTQTSDTESRGDDVLESPAQPGPGDPFVLIDHGEAELNDDQLQGISAGLCLFRCTAQ